MKLIAFAAAALTVAAPAALAQTMPAQDAPPAQKSATTTTTTPGEDPRGGYEPTTPLYSGPVTPNTKVIFQPSTQTPDQAFPAPAPLEEYPVCRPGQYDNCRQRGG